MEDKQIIDLYWARAETAISETAKKYGRYCHSIAFDILHSHEDSEECVNDTLYIQSSDQKGYPEQKDDFVYLGKILSGITNYQGDGADGIPKENFQANHPVVGCEVYQYGENIVVKINGSYWLYYEIWRT